MKGYKKPFGDRRVVADMGKPMLFNLFIEGIVNGRIDLGELKNSQAYLGWSDGTVIDDTRKEIGQISVTSTPDNITFSWPKGEYKWTASEDVDAIVIQSDETLIAWFDLGEVHKHEDVTFNL